MPRAAIADQSLPAEPAGRRFASPAVKAALKRRSAEALGTILAIAGLAVLMALATHDPGDPSLSTATLQAPRNLAGPAGAILSDVLLQGFGWAGALPGVTLLGWAWRLAVHKGLSPFPARVASLLGALPLSAALAARLPLPQDGPSFAGPGGGFGPAVLGIVEEPLAAAFGPMGRLVADGLLVALTGWLVFLALGIPLASWRRAGGTAGKVAGRAAGLAARGGAGMVGRAMRREPRLAGGSLAAPEAAVRYQPEPSYTPRKPGLLRRVFGGLRRKPARTEMPLAAVLRAADAAAEATPRLRRPPATGGGESPSPAPTPIAPRVAERAAPRKAPGTAQPALDFGRTGSNFRLPSLSLLTEAPPRRAEGPGEEALQANARMLEGVLEDYGVRGRIAEIRPGPVVTLYELEPAPGTKSARVIGLADDIARSMSVLAVRIATVPGRNVIGIELPNAKREMVYFSEMMAAADWQKHTAKLPLALGKDIGGAPVIADLARMPHLLIAGTTGSGKSVGINTMILSLLYRFSPDECRFIMIDPKMLELSVYDRIPHLLAPVVTEPPKAIGALKWTVREMERRYKSMSQLGVRNIGGYNEKVMAARAKGDVLTRRVQTGFDPDTGKPMFEEVPLALEALPMIVVVIDEMADLMIVAGKEIEAAVQRLAQMARAAGIHVIMATQRPSVDVITGTIKANFPTRISFSVTSKIDSRTILGEQGAEQLLGQGDMLHMAGGGRIARVHGPFVSDEEVERVVDFLREQGEPQYIEEVTEVEEDDGSNPGLSGIAGGSDAEKSLFDQAVDVVSREGKASTSFIQRHLNIGYNRAAKLIEQMEKEGIVGAANHVGKREVLVRRTED